MKILSSVKNAVLRSDRGLYAVQSGAFSGIRLDSSLRTQTQLVFGMFERELYTALHTLTAGIHTAFDVGSSEGLYLCYLLMRTSARRVLAFEPDPNALETLKRNLCTNGLAEDARLELHPEFVGASTGDRTCVLDSFLHRLSGPLFVKLDVEGAEVGVLQGARKLLNAPDVRWLVETHSQLAEQQCLEILRGANLEVRIIPNAWWRRIIPDGRTLPHNRWLIAYRTSILS